LVASAIPIRIKEIKEAGGRRSGVRLRFNVQNGNTVPEKE
jgi:hypothetical protein